MTNSSQRILKCASRLGASLLAATVAACAAAPASAPVTATRTTIGLILPASPASGALASRRSGLADVGLDVWMFDVGQGSCVVVDCPDGVRPILVDCGSNGPGENQSVDQTVDDVAELIAALGEPAVVISHGDRDHYSLIPRVLEPQGVETVFIGGRRADYANPAKDWLRNVERSGSAVSGFGSSYFGPDLQALDCGSARVDILIANAAAGATKNGDSIVLAITMGDVTVVLPEDAEGITEDQALANRNSMEALADTHAVVIGSHHGARTHDSNGAAWAAAWSPVALAFSQTPDAFGHPQCEVVERYEVYMPRWRGPYPVTCGVGSRVTQTEVGFRVLSSHDNGTTLVRIRPTRMLVYCQIVTAACSGQLPSTALSSRADDWR